jgi:hypothetical protein
MDPQIEVTEKPKKEKKPTIAKEKVERGGDKRWVMFILLVTVFVSLLFYLVSGKFSLRTPNIVTPDIFSGMQEAKYSY